MQAVRAPEVSTTLLKEKDMWDMSIRVVCAVAAFCCLVLFSVFACGGEPVLGSLWLVGAWANYSMIGKD